MSHPKKPDQVKLVASLFSPDPEFIHRAVERLAERYGPVDWMSPELMFDRTRYYEREMGWPLHRRFVTFEPLIFPDELVDVKLAANELEREQVCDGSRRVNIDPGCVSAERLVLATGKNYVHRVYLSRGIYADLTLLCTRGRFVPLEWTYPDYADEAVIDILNGVRKRYMEQLRLARSVTDHEHIFDVKDRDGACAAAGRREPPRGTP